jgi:hypothetical protein
MLSRGRIGVPQARQEERGTTTDRRSGRRVMTTVKNDPNTRPNEPRTAARAKAPPTLTVPTDMRPYGFTISRLKARSSLNPVMTPVGMMMGTKDMSYRFVMLTVPPIIWPPSPSLLFCQVSVHWV